MYKITKIAAVTVLTLTLLVPGFAAADDTKAMVDYSKVKVLTKGKVEIVPLRELAEKLGYQVAWDTKTHYITLTCTTMGNTMMDDSKMMDDKNMDDKNMDNKMDDSKMMGIKYMVKIKVGSKNITVDMSEKMLTSAPTIINNKTYVSKAFVETYLANQIMMK